MTLERFIEDVDNLVLVFSNQSNGEPLAIVMAALARSLITCIDRTQLINRPTEFVETSHVLEQLCGSLAKGSYAIPDPRAEVN